jgi:hypothetical protein
MNAMKTKVSHFVPNAGAHEPLKWRRHTQHNDTQHKDIQHDDIQHYDTKCYGLNCDFND